MTTPKVCPVWVHPSHDLRVATKPGSPVPTFACATCGEWFNYGCYQRNMASICDGSGIGRPHFSLVKTWDKARLVSEFPEISISPGKCVCDIRNLMTYGHEKDCGEKRNN